MDAVKILGSMLGQDALGSQVGTSILDNLLGGGQSGSGGGIDAGDILGSLLGGSRRSGSRNGGLGALSSILIAAATSQAAKKGGRSSGLDALGSLISGGGGSSDLGSILGGRQSSSSGGLGDMVGSILGGGNSPAPSKSDGGLFGSILGAAMGGQQSSEPSGGGLGDLLSSFTGGADSSGGMSGFMNSLMTEAPDDESAEVQEEAELLIEAMCLAARSDGNLDDAEGEAILGRMGELDEDEKEFLREKLTGPVDVDGFISRVPDDMDEQVYAFSLMAIKLDTKKEAAYLQKLCDGLGVSHETCNRIHQRLGQPEIFA